MIVYENGVKKHVKRPKFPLLVATDIVPGKLYLARTNAWSNFWHLSRVQCVREPGWLRGYVNVRGFFTNGFGDYRAYVTIEPIEGRHFDLMVERREFKQPWTFVDSKQALLAEVPSNYISQQRSSLQQLADQHSLESKRLEDKIEQLRALT